LSDSAIFNLKRPRYQLIAEYLLGKIESGSFPLGSLLPSEAKLCSQYSVSRHTIREAIRALAGLGLVEAQAGIGTTVIARRAGNYVQTLKEISDLNDYVAKTSRHILKIETVIADNVSAELPGDQQQSWRMLEAIRISAETNMVVAWTQVFVLPEYSEVLNQVDDEILIYSQVEKKFGIRTGRLRQSISAIAAPEQAAEKLDIAVNSPALGILREYISQDDEIFEVSWSIHPPERYQNKTELVLSLNTH